MAIAANFNTLIFIKNFNNYFNRKIFGGNNLSDYFLDGNFETSGIDFEHTIYFEKGDIFNFIDSSFELADRATNIPYGLKYLGASSTVENGGGFSYGVNFSYDSYTRMLKILVYTDAPSLNDIPDDFKLTATLNFQNNIFVIKENINFNPNDDITAEIITNNIDFQPDYLLVLSEDNSIISRWFILHDARTRSGQYKFQLRRDVIFDNLNEIKEAPIFVQKAMLSEDDSFVVNDEGMSVNQIKTSETLLKDDSKNAWIVIYIAKNTALTDVYGPMGLHVQIKPNTVRNQVKNEEFDMIALPLFDCDLYLPSGTKTGTIKGEYSILIAEAIATTLDASCYDVQLLPYCPFIEKVENGKIYVIDYGGDPDPDISPVEVIESSAGGTSYVFKDENNFETSYIAAATHPYQLNAHFSLLELNIRYADILNSITITKVVGPTIADQTITVDTYHQGADIHLEFDTDPTNLLLSLACNFSIGATSLGVGYIFYCTNNKFTVELDKQSIDNTSLSKKQLSNLTLQRFVSPNYQGSFDINLARNGGSFGTIKAYCTYKPYTPYIKVAPDFSFLYGQNYGDCRGLILGGDFSLPRATDAWQTFQLNNKNYQNIFNREIQNMEFNYSIEMRNQIISGSVGVLGATAAGAGAGAVAGSIVPGIGTAIGAAVGAITGAITSTAGMVVDTITLAERYKENKDLAIDKYNYQLGNIKALPHTLTKVGSFDISSKIWPFVEWYQCTKEEFDAFDNKIKYESMTVMRIDEMSNFYNKYDRLCYFKGELIRNTLISSNYHVLLAIYEELLKGVFI